MDLIKEIWSKKDIEDFQQYLVSLRKEKLRDWDINILKTSLPILGIQTPAIKAIVKEIAKGNYISFLDYMLWDYYENTAINGFLIGIIKDFEMQKKYLDIYSKKADNWATCDLLVFKTKGKEEEYFKLATSYSKSELPFVRRIGMNILFPLVENNDYITKILDLLNQFQAEEHYYVNMVNAWLLCDCFVKQRELTLKFFQKNKLNTWTLNKAIQKCRESRRVSDEDKAMLLKLKK